MVVADETAASFVVPAAQNRQKSKNVVAIIYPSFSSANA